MAKARAPLSNEVEAFPEGKEWLLSIMENAPIGMSLVDHEGRTIFVNQAFADMFRMSRSELARQTVRGIVAPEMVEAAEAATRAVISGRSEGYRAERLYIRRDGTRFWGLVTVSLARQKDHAVPGHIVTQLIDIDAEKRAEAAMAEAESRWNFALESAGQGVWDHDLRRGMSFFSRTWKVMRGMDPDAPFDPSQTAWLARVHPDDREFARQQEQMLTSGDADYHEFEYRERVRDGRYIWILSRGRPVAWNSDGSVARVIGTDTDVTRIKATETQLSAVIATMVDAVALFDLDERLVFCNEQYPGFFPRTAHVRVPGTPLADILRASVAAGEPAGDMAADGEDYVERTRAGLRSGSDTDIELADGRWLYARCRIVADGVGYLSVISDITDRKRVELAQAEVNRRLSTLADMDGLTGVSNRRAFDEVLRSEFARGIRDGRPLALLLIDVDHFKAFNDAYGHPEGDQCLRAVARVLTGALRRRGDRVARIGGEEFAVILPDTDTAGAMAMAERIRSAVRDLRIRHRRSTGGLVTVSVGVALSSGADGPADVEVLVARADTALYAAKAAGRDRIMLSDAETKTAGGRPPAVDDAFGEGI